MLTKCNKCGIGFDTDKLEPWGDCEECFNKKVAEADHPPCPSCESLRAELAAERDRWPEYVEKEHRRDRAELAALTAKCRELDARLGGIIEDERERRGESQYRSGLVVAYEHGRRLLRELGLLARIEKEGE